MILSQGFPGSKEIQIWILPVTDRILFYRNQSPIFRPFSNQLKLNDTTWTAS